jgi:hypothetical protein
MPAEVVPTDEDFSVAFIRRFMGGAAAWHSIKAEAAQVAAERMLRENLAKQRELCAGLPKLTGAAYIAEQERFTALLAEHDELVKLAFPCAVPEVRGG